MGSVRIHLFVYSYFKLLIHVQFAKSRNIMVVRSSHSKIFISGKIGCGPSMWVVW